LSLPTVVDSRAPGSGRWGIPLTPFFPNGVQVPISRATSHVRPTVIYPCICCPTDHEQQKFAKKAYKRAKRRDKKANTPVFDRSQKLSVQVSKKNANPSTIGVKFAMHNIVPAAMGFIGKDLGTIKRTKKVQELLNRNYRYIAWDGWYVPRPIPR
jgi:hypothetical protein